MRRSLAPPPRREPELGLDYLFLPDGRRYDLTPTERTEAMRLRQGRVLDSDGETFISIQEAHTRSLFCSEDPPWQNWNEDETRSQLRLLLGRPLKGDVDYIPSPQQSADDNAKGMWKRMVEAIKLAHIEFPPPAYYVARDDSPAIDGRSCGYPALLIPTSVRDRSNKLNETWKLVNLLCGWGGWSFVAPKQYLYKTVVEHERLIRRMPKAHVKEVARAAHEQARKVYKAVARHLTRRKYRGLGAFFPGREEEVVLILSDMPPNEFFEGRTSEGFAHVRTFMVDWDPDPKAIERHLRKLVDTFLSYHDDTEWWDDALEVFYHAQTYRRLNLEPQHRLNLNLSELPEGHVLCPYGEHHRDTPYVEKWEIDRTCAGNGSPKKGTLLSLRLEYACDHETRFAR